MPRARSPSKREASTRRPATDLGALRAFIDIVEHGSLSAASRATGTPKATLSRQLAELERELGTALLRRSTRAHSLTASGRALHERVAPLLAETEAAAHEVRSASKEPSGLIRISAALGFGQSVLLPLIARFMAQHPGLRCELALSDEPVRVVDAGFDLAIRMGHLEASELPARRLARIERVVVASPAYLAAHGTPRSLADLANHATLVSDPRGARWIFETTRGSEEARVRWRLATGAMPALVEAARLGLGIAYLPRYMVEAQLVAGELVRIDLGVRPTSSFATALIPSARATSAAVRRLLDFLVVELARDPLFSLSGARR